MTLEDSAGNSGSPALFIPSEVDLETKAQQWNVKHQAGVVLTTEQGGLKISLIEMLIQFGAFVEIKANGDAALIQSTGLDVSASYTTVVGLLGQVQNLSATDGDHDGDHDLDWNNLRSAKGY